MIIKAIGYFLVTLMLYIMQYMIYYSMLGGVHLELKINIIIITFIFVFGLILIEENKEDCAESEEVRG